MGIDVNSLLKYRTFPNNRTLTLLEMYRLQSLELLHDVSAIPGLRPRRFLDPHWERVLRSPWPRIAADVNPPLVGANVSRPTLPSYEVFLKLSPECSLEFGADSVRLYFSTRMYLYLTEPALRKAVNHAIQEIAESIRAEEGILCRDESPIILAFDHRQRPFDECVALGAVEENAVTDPLKMYHELPDGTWDCSGYWPFRVEDLA